MRKLGIVALGLAIVILSLVALRGPLSQAVMSRGVEAALSRNVIDELPDGLHVMLCGAGGPLPDPVRSGPCVAVVAGRSLFIVDAGSGGSRNLGGLGLRAGDVRALFLTHYHSDHIDGLGEMALQRWAAAGNEEPLPVYGPTGVQAVVDGFNAAYAADFVYRVAHHGDDTVPRSGAGTVARPFETPSPGAPVLVWDEGGVRITAFEVEHQPVEPAVGYLFEYGGRTALVSGDTKKSAELERMAQGVDLLVHEALADHLVLIAHEAAKAQGNRVLAKITYDIPDYHTTPVEVAEIAKASGAGHLLYYHVVPALPVPGLETAFLEGVDDVYDGGVTVGRDGTSISLPSGSSAIDVD